MIARPDTLGSLTALLFAVAALSPVVVVRGSRIAAGEAARIWQALPPLAAAVLASAMVICVLVGVFLRAGVWRVVAASVMLSTVAVGIGLAGNTAVDALGPATRVSLAYGFWLIVAAAGLLAADGLDRLRLAPAVRRLAPVLALSLVVLLAASGLWQHLSVMREYAARHGVFWRETLTHVTLAGGAVLIAAPISFVTAIAIRRHPAPRAIVMEALNALQTIPSIALFGLLIAPLTWLATHVPGIAELGIRGIGVAPALTALVLYSLMPVLANTLHGLSAASEDVVEAARGMGLKEWQILAKVELPLALPALLAAIRIVLVQNIGLATIAALIGGGGLGSFVFAGMSQTAPDLILLGVVPIVFLCLATSALFDMAVGLFSRGAA